MPAWDPQIVSRSQPYVDSETNHVCLSSQTQKPNLHDELRNQTLAHLCGRSLPCHHSAPLWWSKHEAHLVQGAHTKGHVTHPHFEKVNIFVDILNLFPCYDKSFCLPPIHRKPFKSNYCSLWFYLWKGFFYFDIGRILNIFRVHLHHPS
jgi:hypothetical protein